MMSLFEGHKMEGMQAPHVIFAEFLLGDTNSGIPRPQFSSCPDVSCPAKLLCSFTLFLPDLPHMH